MPVLLLCYPFNWDADDKEAHDAYAPKGQYRIGYEESRRLAWHDA